MGRAVRHRRYSTVRRLAFGPEDDYVTHLGHYYALADWACPVTA
jgi:hypothetical protein